MHIKHDLLLQGDTPRMFPVLADTSKEGRTLSIFLACLENVFEYRNAVFSDIGVKTHTKTRLEIFTEVVLKKAGPKPLRPDGLIIVTNGSSVWKALIEAKVGTSEVTAEQIEPYLELAKLNGIDAVITVSNQFAPLPSHYPIVISPTSAKKAKLFHWSWTYLLTLASLQLDNEEIEGKERRVILSELVRFLSHSGSGVQGFDQMPLAWSEMVSRVQSGRPVVARDLEVQDSVGAWYQQTQKLCSILSRQRRSLVHLKVPKLHASDPFERLRADAERLCTEKVLQAVFLVKDAASPISVTADFTKRVVAFAMTLQAPGDRKTSKSRIGWLIKQLERCKAENVHVRFYWQRTPGYTQHSLEALRALPDVAEQEGKVLSSFEIVYMRDFGVKFGQRKSFIVELEMHFPIFYENVGQHLRAWIAPVAKVTKSTGELPAELAVSVHVEGNSVEVVVGIESEPEAGETFSEQGQLDDVPSAITQEFDFIQGALLSDDDLQVLLRLKDAVYAGALPPIVTQQHADKLRAFRVGCGLRMQAASLAF